MSIKEILNENKSQVWIDSKEKSWLQMHSQCIDPKFLKCWELAKKANWLSLFGPFFESVICIFISFNK